MKKTEYLQTALNMASHNLLCYSKTMAMTAPRDGYESEFVEVKAEVEFLQDWIDEEEQKNDQTLSDQV